MFYAPHTLYKKVTTTTRDSYNRPIKGEESWVFVCDCRCDDNDAQQFETEEGRVFRPQYYIVCPRDADISPNDEVRAMKGDVVRGEGKVYNVNHLNYLGYSVVWV